MAQTEYQKLQNWLFRGNYLDPKTKEIHPINFQLKKRMRQCGLTQAEVSQITGIPKRRLRKILNSWYPMPDWLREQILEILSARIDTKSIETGEYHFLLTI